MPSWALISRISDTVSDFGENLIGKPLNTVIPAVIGQRNNERRRPNRSQSRDLLKNVGRRYRRALSEPRQQGRDDGHIQRIGATLCGRYLMQHRNAGAKLINRFDPWGPQN